MANYVKRGKTWQFEISYKTKDGKFKKLRQGGFRTKSDASSVAIELELELKKGYDPAKKDMLFSDYYLSWIELYKKNFVAPRTYRRYLDSLTNIKKYFEFETISSLTKAKYQTGLNEFAETHAKETSKRFHTHMRSCLLNAIDEKLIFNDFTRGAILSGKVESKKPHEKYLNYSDFKQLMNTCESRLDIRYSSPYLILAGGLTGARFSELLGLTWSDLDFKNLTISINKTWDLESDDFGPLKNESSKRIIDIDKKTAEILKDLKRNQIKTKRDLVFYNEKDGMISSNAVNKTLKKIQKQLDISPVITFHGLRHTNASVLLYKEIDIMYVSAHLGHKDISITQEVYSHILNEMREKIKPRVSSVLESIYD